jgi:hypothetical protein
MAQINPLQPPINYMGMMGGAQDPGQALVQGLEIGRFIRENRLKRQEAEQAQQLREQYAADLQAAFSKGDQRSFAELLAKYPGQEKALSAVMQGMDRVKIDNEFRQGAEISTALENNAPDIAESRLTQIIEARRNAGEDTELYEDILTAVQRGKETGDFSAAKSITNFSLSLVNPEKYKKMVEAGTRAKPDEAGFRPVTAADRKAFADAGSPLPAGVPFQIGPKGEIKEVTRGPLVTIDQGKRDTMALKELDVPRAKEFSDAASSARKLANDSRVIANLLKNASGGRVIKLTTELARDFGLESETVTANDLVNSLATRGAVQIRAPGSGATSDLEFRSYLQAFPSLANSARGRELMARYAEAFAKRSARLADHARKLIREDRYTEEEIARFDDTLGPLLDKDFYDFVGAGPRSGVPAYQGRQSAVPSAMGQATDRAAPPMPSGFRILGVER